MKKFLLVLMFVLPFSANAGLEVEPYLGYTIDGTLSQAGATDSDLSGVGMGARLGYGFLPLLGAGVEFYKGNLTADASGTESDFEPTDIGIYASVDFPILVRAWATYVLSSKVDVAAGEFSGSGFKLGVGFTGLPFVSINLEYTTINYDELNGSSATDVDRSGIMLGVSLPLDVPFL